MERQRLMVGYDLCADYSQISYYNTEKEEPDSVNFDGQNEIPTVLCRLFSNGEWLAGQQALKAAEAGNGVLVRDFIVRIADDPMVDVAGERMEKAGLIGIFFQKTLKALETVCEGAEVGFITITMEDVDLATADALKRAAASMGIGAQLLALESHRLSYEYYALSQRRELWTHDVGLFEYDRRGLRYHHLSVSWKYHPPVVTAETTVLNQYLDGHELADPVPPEMDRQFLEAIKEVSARRMISTYYLMGEGFSGAESGKSWMNLSLKQLCAMKRHVFAGQNLYARGACYHSFDQGSFGRKPGFIAANAGLLTKDIYLRSVHKHAPQKLILAAAGTPWYSAVSRKAIIIDGQEQLIIRMRDPLTNFEQTAVMTLDALPQRPPKTTKLLIETFFQSETDCHIRVTDMGFGEIFAATGKVWEMHFDIGEASEASGQSAKEAVIEATIPQEVFPLDMKMSGTRIFSLEELCWYLSKNVYITTYDLFDEKMFFWMDKITGSHSLALALFNYKSAGKPLKEIVRLLLNAVDYLDNGEIARIYNKLTEMEHQNPLEQMRLAADNYNRYGHYMAALKNYHHVVYQMTHDYDSEMTRQFKADTWHNMGMVFLRLHNIKCAAECMKRAFELVKTQDFLAPYMYVLELLGDHEKILTLIRQEDIPTDISDAVLNRYKEAEHLCEHSEENRKIQDGLTLGNGQTTAKYWDFVRDYLNRQKKNYDLT